MAGRNVTGELRESELNWLVYCVNSSNNLHSSAPTWAHFDATMRLFDPQIRPSDIRPRQQRARNTWLRPGECPRVIYDELREATKPARFNRMSETRSAS